MMQCPTLPPCKQPLHIAHHSVGHEVPHSIGLVYVDQIYPSSSMSYVIHYMDLIGIMAAHGVPQAGHTALE